MNGEQEKWPTWLSERGINPGQRFHVGGLVLEPAGEVKISGSLIEYRVSEAGLMIIWEKYGR